jgi:endonuclease/exonuclease/phosphatase family metal-dependent hydrolase
VAQLINDFKPDLVALQEIDSMTNRSRLLNDGEKMDLMEELERRTGMEGFFAKAIDYGEGGYGIGILSRHPAEFRKMPLPNPKEVEARSLALAMVTLPDGEQITFASTHLCNEFEENRLAQTKAIFEILQSKEHPVLLAGDFNFTPDESPYALLQKDFIDVAEKKGEALPTSPSNEPRNRIDFVWLSKESDWEILDVKVLGEDHSDHLPVLVKLQRSR